MIDYSRHAKDKKRRKQDVASANAEWKRLTGKKPPAGYTWHHQWVDVDTGRGEMVLVKSNVHKAATHTGAFAVWGKALKAGADPTILGRLRGIANRLGVVGKKAAGPVCLLFMVGVAQSGYAEGGVSGVGIAIGRDIVMADQVEWLVLQSIRPCGDFAEEILERGRNHRRCMEKSCQEIGTDPQHAPINRWGG